MEQGRLSGKQLFMLIFLFELGSAIVVAPGMQAKQDAWPAILLGMTAGLGMLLVYGYLYMHYPSLPLTRYVRVLLGKYIGIPIAYAYALYFIYLSARVLRDFGELLVSSALANTPMPAVFFLMMVSVVWAAYAGIEVLGRVGEILFSVIVCLIIVTAILIVSSGVFHPENLLPILEEGWKPVVKTAFPLTFTFPFGEVIVFANIFPYVARSGRVIKTGLLSMLVSGLVLTTIVIFDISVLGVRSATMEQFPLLATVSRIFVGHFIQRVDAIALSALILGGFCKISIFFYAGVTGIKDLLQIEQEKTSLMITSVVAVLVIVIATVMAGSYAEHIEIGLQKVPFYLHLPFQVGIPFLLLAAAVFQRKREGTYKL